MALKRKPLRLNYLAFVAAGLFPASTFFSWWGLDVFSTAASYSFRWSMWGGPLVQFAPASTYSWVNNLNQVLSSGTSVIGTLGWVTAALTLTGISTRHTRLLASGLVLSVSVLLLYLGVVTAAVTATLFDGNNYTSHLYGLFGYHIETTQSPPGWTLIETWGFQTGFFIYMAGIAATFCALAYDRWFLQPAIERAEERRSILVEGRLPLQAMN
jgi:hypothetical protein